jgi:hypothetical protein
MAYTLTLNFTPPTPNTNSYRVKYWPQSDPTNITTSTTTGSPFVAYNLTECSYSGTIETICGGTTYSTAQPFSINICTLSYTPCALVTSPGVPVPSEIRLGSGVTDITTGVTLYDQNNNILTGVTLISSSTGVVYNVVNGVVTSPTGDQC